MTKKNVYDQLEFHLKAPFVTTKRRKLTEERKQEAYREEHIPLSKQAKNQRGIEETERSQVKMESNKCKRDQAPHHSSITPIDLRRQKSYRQERGSGNRCGEKHETNPQNSRQKT